MTADKPTTEHHATAKATEVIDRIPPRAQAVDFSEAQAEAPPKDDTEETKPVSELSGLTREQLEARVKSLSSNLAAANTESEYFRKQWQNLRLRDAALGVEELTVDERKLEEKHVEAVAEYYQSEMKRREALQLLEKLLATTGKLIQTAPKFDPAVRNDYEVAARAAKEYLDGRSGSSIPIGATLAEGQISSIDTQINAVVINLGKNQGVKEGMTFSIYQNKDEVGTLKIVLTRDLISSGPVDLKPNVVLKVGDRVSVSSQ